MIRMEKNVFFLIDHTRHFDRVVWNISLKCIQGFLSVLLAGVSKRFRETDQRNRSRTVSGSITRSELRYRYLLCQSDHDPG